MLQGWRVHNMATEGSVGQSFNCQLRMEAAIHCGHQVRITGPGLHIAKDGVTAQELLYNFGVDNWSDPQDINIIGDAEGRFQLYCKITSAFYMSFNKLKVKDDKIQITILDFQQGWHGDKHGLTFLTGLEAGCVSPDVVYQYKIPIGGGAKVITIKADGIGGGLAVKMSGPSGSSFQETPSLGSSTGLIFSISDEGNYSFHVFVKGFWGNTSDGTLGSVTFDAYVDGVLTNSTSVQQRGKILQRDTTSTESTLYTQFTDTFGSISNEFEPYLSFNMVDMPINPPPVNANFSGNISYSDGSGFTASGEWELRGYVYTIGATCIASGAPAGVGSIGIQCFLNK
jgi:hypothetical protein